MTEPLTPESTSRHVVADGVRLHLHEAGAGPLLLLIHGGAPGAYGWGNFGQNMAAFAKRFRTVIVDLPGYGQSELPSQELDGPEGGRYAFYARVFAALIRELGASSAHVVGLATGGAAAMAMALDHPEVVDRLVLVSSAGGLPLFTPTPSEGQKAIRSYYGGRGPSREKMVSYLELMLHDQELVTDELVEDRYQASLLARPQDVGSPEQLWTRLHQITAPTLVVWGRDNRVQGYDNALFLLQRIPDVEVHIFGRTGLWVPYERAARFEALIGDFLP
ncbi:alpha/beta fold hydrolase [Nocardioides sp. Iso805N]|uniref:alpha/beta fold hydrolase n=1 Tax=Nocardioides sp. Iso805N TaxID=1283287 RepID=UPI00055E868A|nr:alpha/beta hydrolase [Nocardioides sp. Iso805N]